MVLSAAEYLKSVSWKTWLLLVVLVSSVVFMGYFERERYKAIYNLCNKDYLVYSNFTQESVCHNHPLSMQFAALGLVNCSKALEKVEDERPDLCALRNWFLTSWVKRLMNSIETFSNNLYEKTTSLLMVTVVAPVVVLIGYWIYLSEMQKTARHALTMEQQSKPMDAMNEMFSRVITLSNSQHYIEDKDTPEDTPANQLRKRKANTLNLKVPRRQLETIISEDEEED